MCPPLTIPLPTPGALFQADPLRAIFIGVMAVMLSIFPVGGYIRLARFTTPFARFARRRLQLLLPLGILTLLFIADIGPTYNHMLQVWQTQLADAPASCLDASAYTAALNRSDIIHNVLIGLELLIALATFLVGYSLWRAAQQSSKARQQSAE